MSDLSKLESQIQERLEAVEPRRKRRQQLMEHQLAEGVERSRQFGKIADRVVQTVIRPRVALLVDHFENSELLPVDGMNRYH